MSAPESIAHLLIDSYPYDWNRIKIENIPAALDEGLRLAKLKLAKLEALPLKDASYETFFVPFEYLAEELSRAWSLCDHFANLCDCPQIRQIQEKYTPLITEFFALITQNSALYERAQAVAASPSFKKLNALQRRLVSESLRGFKHGGAALPTEKKSELLQIKKQLSLLTQKYSQFTLDALNAYEKLIPLSEAAATLKGLPPSALSMAQLSAEKSGKPGFYRFTLHQPSLEAVLLYAENRPLREELWRAFNGLCVEGPFATENLISEILELRERLAKIIGYENFSEFVTSDRMLKPPAKIREFLDNLYTYAHLKAMAEFNQLTSFKKSLGDSTAFEPWDNAYYREKLQEKELSLSTEALRPFFEFNASLKAIFTLCETIFGLSFKKIEGHKAWHESVDYYEVYDKSTSRLIGGFYTDFFPRKEKRSGAWMSGMLSGRPNSDGTLTPIVGCICGNFMPPTADTPSLLKHDELTTLFHEFGHLLHGLLTTVPIPSMSGTAVAWDFVELPSQLMENYCFSTEYLPTLARHYQTGETLPPTTVAQLQKTQKFMAGLFCLRQLSFGGTDIYIHTTPAAKLREGSLMANVETYYKRYRLPFQTPPVTPFYRFGHLFSDVVGYASGYYSYKWSQILECDVWKKFEADGILKAATGDTYRRKILARGNSAEPMELFKDYLGREPQMEAYLRKEGFIE